MNRTWTKWKCEAEGAWSRGVDVRKTGISVLVLGCIAMCALVFLTINDPEYILHKGSVLLLALINTAAILTSMLGAVYLARKERYIQEIELTVSNLEKLNDSMRTQRHDFKNHIQVVSALLELEEYDEALNYIKRVNVDMQTVGKALKTSLPPVNALLLAKASICEQKNIVLELKVTSILDALPVESWKFCRVLANLIDNAIDAIEESGQRGGYIELSILEDGSNYKIHIANNGPKIPLDIQKKIFQPNFSTKGQERGMGMTIIQLVLNECGGEIALRSDDNLTEFKIEMPIKKVNEDLSA